MAPRPGSKFTLKPHDTIIEGDAVGVLLSNRPDRVWVNRSDYERIVGQYGNKAWSWHAHTNQCVHLRVSQTKSVPVARLVLDSTERGRVWYADEDRLNLRRSNLSVMPPGSVAPRLKRAGQQRRRMLNAAQSSFRLPSSAPPPELRPMPKREPVVLTTRVQPNTAMVTVKRTRSA